MAGYIPRTDKNTNSSRLTNHFRFILDPSSIDSLSFNYLNQVDKLFIDMELVKAPVVLEVYVSNKFNASNLLFDHPIYSEWVKATPQDWQFPPFELNKIIEENIRDISPQSKETIDALGILGIGNYCQADGIVSNNRVLVEHRHQIYQYHRQRIVPLAEFPGIIEIILHGNSIFLSADDSCLMYDNDTFYQACHWKAKRYFKWFQNSGCKKYSEDFFPDLHSALLNRYPYIVYSRDMVKYYELQQDYFFRSGKRQSYGLTLGYYLNYFYLLLWGMMDSLALIAKKKLDLPVNEAGCSISKSKRTKKYWQLIKDCLPGLYEFVNNGNMQEWICIMADMRHHAAHKPIKRPSLLLNKNSELQPDDEIRSEIKRENPELYEQFPDQMRVLEEIELQTRKMDQYEILAPRMTQIDMPDGRIFMRDFVLSIDYDLERLNAVVDAFIFALFNEDS